MVRPFKATGEWSSEPNEDHWEDRGTGFQCRARRNDFGAWCGYVGVPEGHPAWGLPYSKRDYEIEEVTKGLASSSINSQWQINAIVVHGGLTFSGSMDNGGNDTRWWFGFDCSHAGDFSPSADSIERLNEPTGWGSLNAYRNLAYVKSECAALAEQLGQINPNLKPVFD